MKYNRTRHIFTKLNQLKFYILFALIGLSILISHNHFFPTVSFVFDSFLSNLPGNTDIIPDASDRKEALLFTSKIGATFFTALAFLTVIGLFFAQVIGLTQMTEDLHKLRERHTQTLRKFTDLQRDCIHFFESIEQVQNRQKYTVSKSDTALQALSIETINLQNIINGLALQMDQLRAISAAISKELDSSDDVDKGDF